MLSRVGPALGVAVLAAGALFAAPQAIRAPRDPFPHDKHAKMFPLCVTCHAGVGEPGQPMFSDDGQIAWLCVPSGLVSREFLSAEDLVGYPRSVRGVRVAVLFSEEAPGKIKASLRGKGDVPVNAIAQRFGGGGHENAAGCTPRTSITACAGPRSAHC